MTRHRVSASLHAKICLAAFVLVLGMMGVMLVRADSALQQSFDVAVDAQVRSWPGEPGRHLVSRRSSENDVPASHAASEDYWLGHAQRSNAVPVAWTNAVEIGERIVLGATGGRVLRVEAISPLSVGHPLGPGVFIVTAREEGRSDGVVMRFLIEDRTGSLSRDHRQTDNRDL